MNTASGTGYGYHVKRHGFLTAERTLMPVGKTAVNGSVHKVRVPVLVVNKWSVKYSENTVEWLKAWACTQR